MPLVTFNMTYDSLAQHIESRGSALYNAQAHAQSGLRVMTPSDDPVATAQASLLGTGLQQLNAMASAAQQASLLLNNTDQALRTASNLTSQARELVVRALNATNSAEDRAGMANEAGQLHASLLAVANTRVTDTYLFSGNLIDTSPFTADGTYRGNAATNQVEIAPNQFTIINVPGSQVFNKPGGQNILAVFQALTSHLQSNDISALQNDLTNLNAATQQVAQAQVMVGGALANVQQGNQTRQNTQLLLAQQKSDLTELNTAQGLMQLLQAQQAYQAAISEATRILMGLENSLTR